jgi:hypothetical protein
LPTERIEAASLKLALEDLVCRRRQLLKTSVFQDLGCSRFGLPWGTMTMLSVDQFLRLISLPAVVVAFLIASQISGTGIIHTAHAQIASQ